MVFNGEEPRRPPLADTHKAAGARSTHFAGWELPVQYPSGPTEEHLATRRAAGLFDIDHMGQVEVKGADGRSFLQHVTTADLRGLAAGEAKYALLCYADGGAVDDIFIYCLADRFFVVLNAANRAKDLAWLQALSVGYGVSIRDISDETYMLALQGPRSEAILQPLCAANLANLARHHALETEVMGIPTLIGRTGYTGEDGFELYFPTARAGDIWDALLEKGHPTGLLPAGLAARDSLRFEACMPLYGQEITAVRGPVGAGLGWAVAWDKGDFIGRDALLKERLEGPHERLVGLKLTERGVPRPGYRV
ncbi:MAG: glycine cleavage system aminomethyltransferase GcvT, partial [bacterium]|nr:glycine cleavage system aminomethyltransferase GcvT [bacterium]